MFMISNKNIKIAHFFQTLLTFALGYKESKINWRDSVSFGSKLSRLCLHIILALLDQKIDYANFVDNFQQSIELHQIYDFLILDNTIDSP